MPTLAVFGAGPGLGMATARRFGPEGFRVALVARGAQRLDAFVAELAGEGIEAAAFPADLTDRDRHPELVADIRRQLEPIEVGVISGFMDSSLIRPVLDVDTGNASTVLENSLLPALSLTHLLLPELRDRGDGALLLGLGASSKLPMPELGSYGIVGAGLRNYLLSLNTALAGERVYVGVLNIGVLIRHSDAEREFDGTVQAQRGLLPQRRDPEELAEKYWHLYTHRDTAEIDVLS